MTYDPKNFEEFARDHGLQEPLPGLILPSGSTTFSDTARKLFPVLARRHRYFVRGKTIVEIAFNKVLKDKQAHDVFQILDPDALRSRIDHEFNTVAWREKGGEFIKKPARISHDAAVVLLKTDEAYRFLPAITTLASCPVLAGPPGKLQILYKGYHETGGGIYVLHGNSKIEIPSVQEATSLIVDILGDYQFVTQSDKSRAVASFISPTLRAGSLLDGADFPLDIAEANESQSGKTFRQKLVCAAYRVIPYVVTNRVGGVGSLDESFSTALISGVPFILIDNFRGRLQSQILDSCLRGIGFANPRVPHRGEVQVPTTYLNWMLSSNGIEGNVDIGNRSVITRITKQPLGYQFQQFPEGNILAHIRATQEKVLGAIFAVVMAWDSAGRSRTSENRHDFTEWWQSLDWIVQNLFELPPLLDGHTEEVLRMCDPALSWLRLVAIALEREKRLDVELPTTEIVTLCESCGIDIPGAKAILNPEQLSMQAGRLLGRIFAQKEQASVDRYKVTRISRTEVPSWDPTRTLQRHFYFFKLRE
jgi:hypothetical protein